LQFSQKDRDVVRVYTKWLVADRDLVQCAVTPHIPYVRSATIAEQAVRLFEKLEERLTQFGSDKSHIMTALIILADIRDYASFNEAWAAWIDPEEPPARLYRRRSGRSGDEGRDCRYGGSTRLKRLMRRVALPIASAPEFDDEGTR
jgi:hypothetical protein